MSRSHSKAPAQGAGRSAGEGLSKVKRAAQVKAEREYVEVEREIAQQRREASLELARQMHEAVSKPAKPQPCHWCGSGRSVAVDHVWMNRRKIGLCQVHIRQVAPYCTCPDACTVHDAPTHCSCGQMRLGEAYGAIDAADTMHTHEECTRSATGIDLTRLPKGA